MSNDKAPILAGSNPAARTIFPEENEVSSGCDTNSTQNQADSGVKVRFPQRIKFRGQVVTIYGKTKARPDYRVAWRVNGKRQLQAFQRFGGPGGAKEHAEKIAKDLAKGGQVSALSPDQARDAMASLERLETLRESTGKRVSLLSAVSQFVEAASKLNGDTLGDAVERYLNTVANVKRKDIAEAVEEFIKADEPRTRASDGQRAQLSEKYAYNRAIHLRKFAETFPSTAVCDLSKAHLDTFMASLNDRSPKTRNHHRTEIVQLLGWCVRRDYLPPMNRLGEADSLRPEHANTAEIAFYTPNEFRALLEAANGPIQAMIALGGLAGLRTVELLRLDWDDVWRVPGHIEIGRGKSKTRQRRLIEICPALSAWLEPFRELTKGKLWDDTESVFQKAVLDLCDNTVVTPGKKAVGRKANGLRHSFCTFHYALHTNENLTASQAGNSPGMIHGHYKGLATRAEAEKWFNVAPAKADNVVSMGATAP